MTSPDYILDAVFSMSTAEVAAASGRALDQVLRRVEASATAATAAVAEIGANTGETSSALIENADRAVATAERAYVVATRGLNDLLLTQAKADEGPLKKLGTNLDTYILKQTKAVDLEQRLAAKSEEIAAARTRLSVARDTGSATAGLERSLGARQREWAALDTSLTKVRADLAPLGAALTAAGVDTSDLAAAQAGVKARLEATTAEIERLKAAVRSGASVAEADITAGLERAIARGDAATKASIERANAEMIDTGRAMETAWSGADDARVADTRSRVDALLGVKTIKDAGSELRASVSDTWNSLIAEQEEAFQRIAASGDPVLAKNRALAKGLEELRSAGTKAGIPADQLAAAEEKLVQSFTRASANAEQEARALSDLTDRLEPAGVAARQTAADQAALNAALASGAITADRHAELSKKLQTSARGAGGALGGLRNAAQQAGYQVGDAAVQLQMGTDATMVLTQQGSQLAGAFGPVGAVIGGVGAVAGAVIVAVGGLSAESRAAAAAARDHEKAQKALDGTLAASATTAAELARRYQSMTDAQKDIQRASLASALRSQKKEVEDGAKVFAAALKGVDKQIESYDVVLNARDRERKLGRLPKDGLSARLDADTEEIKRRRDALKAARDAYAKTGSGAAFVQSIGTLGDNWGERGKGVRDTADAAVAAAKGFDAARQRARETAGQLDIMNGKFDTANAQLFMMAHDLEGVDTSRLGKGALLWVNQAIEAAGKSKQAVDAVIDAERKVVDASVQAITDAHQAESSASEETLNRDLAAADERAAASGAVVAAMTNEARATSTAAETALTAERDKSQAVASWARSATAASERYYATVIDATKRSGRDTKALEAQAETDKERIWKKAEDQYRGSVDRLIAEETRHTAAAKREAESRDSFNRSLDSRLSELARSGMSDEEAYASRREEIAKKTAAAQAAATSGQWDKAKSLAEETISLAERNAQAVKSGDAEVISAQDATRQSLEDITRARAVYNVARQPL